MSDQIKEKTKKIEALYQDCIGKIEELKAKQNQIIGDFIKKLEEAKMDEIRSKIGK